MRIGPEAGCFSLKTFCEGSSVRFFDVLFFNNMAGFALGSFWVRFFHSYIFSITSRLRFWVRFWLCM
jgi:uncharacterized membrane protein YjjP (DUF1212 family)